MAHSTILVNKNIAFIFSSFLMEARTVNMIVMMYKRKGGNQEIKIMSKLVTWL